MKSIALMPVKNEDWIIGKTIKALDQFCDVIIIADEGSTDSTIEIVKGFNKVVVINNNERFLSHNVRTLLLDAARNYDGNNLIFNFDADEIPSSAILNPNTFQLLNEIPVGHSIILDWIQLWKSTKYYRNDSSVWTNNKKHFIFKDDRKSGYETKNFAIDHVARVPSKTITNSISMSLPILHFQFVLFDRMLSKQRWYRAIEQITTTKTIDSINLDYLITRDERNMKLNAVPEEWIKGWNILGIDFDTFSSKPYYWYDLELLDLLSKYGLSHFSELDIWDINWELKRRTALTEGISGVPIIQINDPRTIEQKLYHSFLHHFYKMPPWRKQIIIKQLLWKLGVRRKNLEKLGLIKKK